MLEKYAQWYQTNVATPVSAWLRNTTEKYLKPMTGGESAFTAGIKKITQPIIDAVKPQSNMPMWVWLMLGAMVVLLLRRR